MRFNFYKVFRNNRFRFYYPKTFISKFFIPVDLRLIEKDIFSHFRPGLTLFFNESINRYVLYREFEDKYVLISVIDDGRLGFREPGEWILWKCREGDIFKSGNIDPKKAIKAYEDEMESPSETERDSLRRTREIQEEMQKDWERVLSGRIGLSLGLFPNKINRKVKKEKVVFGFYQGKLYRRKKKC